MISTLRYIWHHPLASKNRIFALWQWIRWQLGSRLLGAPVICSWIGNCKLVVETGMTGATGNLYCGLHEFNDMAFLLHLLRPEDSFADIGANIGSYTVLASGYVGAKSRSFEPHPDTCRNLLRNVMINGIEALVDIRMKVVGREAGILKFTADCDTMNQVVVEDYHGTTINVPVNCLNEELSKFEAVLWKIDVEGFETEVLEGAQEKLKEENLKAIIIESENSRIVELLQINSFERVEYLPFQRQLLASDGKVGSNSLWIRDRSFCEDRVQNAPKIHFFGVSF